MFVRPRLVMSLMTSTAFVSLPRQRHAALCIAERPASFFGGGRDEDEENSRLRSENERLKGQLADAEKRANSTGVVDNVKNFFGLSKKQEEGRGMFDGVKEFLGLKKKEEDPIKRELERANKELDRALTGTGLLGGVVGTLVKGVMSMAGGMMRESGKDMSMVTARVEEMLEPSLGVGVKCDPPMSQGYSSSNINGRTTKRIQFSTTAAADNGVVADVDVVASITDGALRVDQLYVNGRPLDGGGPGDASYTKKSKLKGSDTIIDV